MRAIIVTKAIELDIKIVDKIITQLELEEKLPRILFKKFHVFRFSF